MRRALLTVIATGIGLYWVVTFRISPRPLPVPSAAVQPASTPTPAAIPPPAATNPSPTPTPAPAGVTGTFTGPVVSTFYGPVQIRITVRAGRVVDSQGLQMPVDHQRSAYISQYVAPILRSEVLKAQSAQIDAISGATYTSDGYAQSLSVALTQAHIG